MTIILIIEDEKELVKVLRSYLENAGFDVITAYRGDTGLNAWQNRQPDLVILDLNLPGMDGLDVAREIRRRSGTPLIMLTARVEEADQLVGLEIGADDYIAKPFSPRVVVARVRALLRRLDFQGDHDGVVRVAGIEIDRQAHAVMVDGLPVDLTPTEFNLLVVLASYPGRAFTRLQLLEATQGTAYDGYERTIDTHIKNLRAKLATEPGKPSCIETVFGVGYRFMKGNQR